MYVCNVTSQYPIVTVIIPYAVQQNTRAMRNTNRETFPSRLDTPILSITEHVVTVVGFDLCHTFAYCVSSLQRPAQSTMAGATALVKTHQRACAAAAPLASRCSRMPKPAKVRLAARSSHTDAALSSC